MKDSTGVAVDVISPAWARDAKLQKVPSKYRVTDAYAGLFVQDVEHKQPYVVYPVVADPFRLEIRFPGLRGYTGPNGLELRFNNYATELLVGGGMALTVYVTGGGVLVVGLISRYSATGAKFIPWFSGVTIGYILTNDKCLGITIPIYWWGIGLTQTRYWVENC